MARRNFRRSGWVMWLAFLSPSLALAQLPDIPSSNVSIEVQTVATSLASPVDLVSVNDGTGRLFIVEQGGRIKILQNGAVSATPFLNLSGQISSGGEKGLLGLAFHPGFADSASPGFRKLYTYATENPSGTADFTVPMSGDFDNQCVVTEWQVSVGNPNVVNTASRRDVLRIDHPQGNHNGGEIAFRPSDGFLYIAIGDGGAGNDVGDGHTPNLGNAQDISNLLGKILRIDPLAPSLTPGNPNPASANGKYRNPANNPFVNAAGLDEIYAYGFRNPYRFSFDPVADQMIVGDVGQGAIEEVDLVERGGNYGWNRKEGSFLFNPSNGAVSPDSNPNPAFTNPVLEYDHDDGVSVIGGFVYRGSAIPALAGRYVFGEFLGRLFVGDFGARRIEELRLGINARDLGLRVTGFGTDTAGEVYVVGTAPGSSAGQILKIVPIPGEPALVNLSTRARVELDDNGVAIGGFVIEGSAPKTVVVRAIGPSLSLENQPVAGRLSNPTLSLHSSSAMIDSNDNWMTHPRSAELGQLQPQNPLESAIVVTLQPGVYTAIMRTGDGTPGIGLVEVFDVSQSSPANTVNLSTRGRVQSGDNVMIGGLVIGGTGTLRVLVRAIGPSLTAFGVSGALANPTVELFNSSGTRIRFNDNWRSDQQSAISASGLAPGSDAEAALIETLSPGAYTAIVRSADSSVGTGLVEVYRLSP